MDRRLSVLFFVVLVGFPGYLSAQSARGIIAPSRMIDWTHAGVQGGIPNRSTVCATLSPGATAAQISSAIASCPSGEVVYLNAGTYKLSAGIVFNRKSNVTLRGAGPMQTFLVFTGYYACSGGINATICVYGDPIYSTPTNLANWTGGYSRGSTQVTLSNTANLSVGSYIEFDQTNDTSDTGGVFVCDTSGVCSQKGFSSNYRSGRAQNQVAMVTAINGNTVTIEPGIYMPQWSGTHSPEAYWPTTQASMDGIEDLSIDNTGNTSGGVTAISLSSVSNCWVKNVRSLNPYHYHVTMRNSAHNTVEDSYFYGTQAGTTNEYGVQALQDSDSLVINNIFQHIATPLVAKSVTGSVFAYNYSTDNYYVVSPNWLHMAIANHTAGTSFVLWEGNQVQDATSDDIWGTHNFLTFFRNRVLGWDDAWGTPTSGKMHTNAMELQAFGRYYNVIGNVLGEPGYHTQYQDLAPSGTNEALSIYVLGWSGNGGKTGNPPDDPNVVTTLMRWGNYDTVTGAVRWNSSEVPSSLSKYANPVPSSRSLPASFFLSARPSWWSTPWGTPPWPAIGPDVTGGPGPGGHSYDIPAKLCYDNTSKDSNGILNFNANNCYANSTAPAAPTNLGATAH